MNDDRTALLYLESAIQVESQVSTEDESYSGIQKIMGSAINFNNMGVIQLKQQNY